MNEQWRQINGFPDYDVSDHGRVRSRDRYITEKTGMRRFKAGRVLKHFYGGQMKYPLVQLGRGNAKYVHHLVAETFIGECPAGCEVAHVDGNRNNNAASNLLYCTHIENESHKVRHGTKRQGEKVVGSKLTEQQVREIRTLHKSKTDRELADMYAINPAYAWQIRNNKRWRHVVCVS